MSQVSHRADIKLATATLEAIEQSVLAGADDGLRPHLGASQIGKPCERELWYSFRWAKPSSFEPRMLRLFARGQREEDTFATLLRSIHGVQLVQFEPNTGKQFNFKTGHFGGSMDGACVGLPDAPQTWHVWECKTHSEKSFNALVKDGVQKAKPEHYAQCIAYMAWTGMTRALYTAVCKNTDRLHLERIDFDKAEADRLFAKAQRIIDAVEPPPGISERPDWYECKLCDYHAHCHASAVPLPTCRSCAHVTPVADAQWHCARHNKVLTVAEQKQACQSHRFIPVLLRNFADVVDADTESNWVKYKHRVSGNEFTNGLPPEGYESVEIYSAEDKKCLGDASVQAFRKELGAKIAA